MNKAADIVIVGGGPAGMMTGLLFARAGIETLVLEKHGDFFRDFRGDTVHPSTMEVLSELGLLQRFLDRPHNRIDRAELIYNGCELKIAEFARLRTPAPFIAMMPQWDFLDFLRDEAEAYPEFALRMDAQVSGLVGADRISGVQLKNGEELLAGSLVIIADGRDSLVRQNQLLPLEQLGAPIDVCWFRLPKQDGDNVLRGIISGSSILITIDREDYWQCAFVIAKGNAQEVQAMGIANFRDRLQETAPELTCLADSLPDWDAVKLLSVSLDRLTRWHRPGLLAIGDAAHAMSPVGGVGINLAIQDAVAAANLLARPMAEGRDADPLLHTVQDRRMLPTRIIQAGQRAAHKFVLEPLIAGCNTARKPPAILRLLNRFAPLRRLPARIIGLGFRRERLTAPAAER